MLKPFSKCVQSLHGVCTYLARHPRSLYSLSVLDKSRGVHSSKAAHPFSPS